MNSPRKHQAETRDACNRMIAGEAVNRIDLSVTPGGGKSTDAVIIAAKLISSGMADKICWVVPRVSLQKQAEKAFLNDGVRKWLGHDLKIRVATNDLNPSRGLAGFVTTYQALASDTTGIIAKEFERHRYILFLDEFHHLSMNGPWHKPCQTLYDLAAIKVLASGGLGRGDNNRIAFLRYHGAVDGKLIPNLERGGGREVIHYGLRDALREHAVINTHFFEVDGKAEWLDRTGQVCAVGSLRSTGKQANDAVYAAIHTDYAKQLLNDCLDHFSQHQQSINPLATCLVVAPRVQIARQYLEWIKARGFNAAIAVSEDAKAALDAIDEFKSGHSGAPRVLVTVAMAYEGLDVPSVSHIACLTHIRSPWWISQCFARGNRVHYEAMEKYGLRYEDMVCHVWVPSDPNMLECMQLIKDEQSAVALESGVPNETTGEGPFDKGERRHIAPLSGLMTDKAMSDIRTEDRLDPQVMRTVERAMRTNGLFGVSPLQFLRAVRDAGFAESGTATTGAEEDTIVDPTGTPSEMEARIRSSISKHVSRFEAVNSLQWGEINRTIYTHFGKPRDQMTLDELSGVWAWLNENCPL